MVVDSATDGEKNGSSGPFCLVAAWDYGRADYAIATGMCGYKDSAIATGMCGYRGSFCVSCVTRSIRGGPNAGCGQHWRRGLTFVVASATGG